MIPGDIATRLRQLTENTVQPLSIIHKLPANLPELVPGQPFTARIQNPLPDGSFQALVAGKTVTLALPHSVKSGDVLELIVTGQREQTLTAKLAPSALPADDAPQSSLSQTGRLISQLLTGRFGEQRATPLAAGEPLLPAAPGKPQELTPRLQQAVAQSGLFYESHLKAWAEGRAALASLLREPHARYMPGKSHGAAQATFTPLGETAAHLPTTAAQTANASSLASPVDPKLLPTLLGGEMAGETLSELEASATPLGGPPLAEAGAEPEVVPFPAQTGAPPADEPVANQEARATAPPKLPGSEDAHNADAPAGDAAEPGKAAMQAATANANSGAQRLPEPLMPLIYQQLETMATHQLQYQFQPWPGMNAEWDIIEPDRDDTPGADADKAWRSSLRLQLPKLGEVDALLVLGPQGLSIRLDADSEVSAAKMREAGNQLLDALAGVGLSVNALSVSKHDSA